MPNYQAKSVVFRGVLDPSADRKPARPLVYSVIAQTREDLASPDNSPSVSMWPYLLASAQTQRLNEISIYAEAGLSPEKMRFLYLNDVALAIWHEMHPDATDHGGEVLTRMARPPRGAVLSFGMPFAE